MEEEIEASKEVEVRAAVEGSIEQSLGRGGGPPPSGVCYNIGIVPQCQWDIGYSYIPLPGIRVCREAKLFKGRHHINTCSLLRSDYRKNPINFDFSLAHK